MNYIPPHIVSLCPAWNRAELLGESIWSWCRQTYPAERRSLIIGVDPKRDDWQSPVLTQEVVNRELRRAGESELIPRVTVLHCSPGEAACLPRKYNAMASWAYVRELYPKHTIFTAWEDDDIYLPYHLSRLESKFRLLGPGRSFVGHPRFVLSDYTGQVQLEDARGRFHAALALRADVWFEHPWFETKAADFDQQYLSRLHHLFGLVNYDLNRSGLSIRRVPSYLFRWRTGALHGQEFMSNPNDETWQSKARSAAAAAHPEFDLNKFRIEFSPSTLALWSHANAIGLGQALVPASEIPGAQLA